MSAARPASERTGVIALVPDQWGPPWSVRHHVLRRLALHFTTVWVTPALALGDRPDAQTEDNQPASAYGNVPGLLIYRPSGWLPRLYRPAFLARLLEKMRLLRARRLLYAAGCDRVVLYLWRPEFASAMDLISHDVSCYHVDDEYTFSEVEKPTSDFELRLLQRVDLVIVHSAALLEKKGSINTHTIRIPNGVDYRAFSTPAMPPTDLAAIPRPRISYIGVIKTQLDIDLLCELAQRHPQWSIVLVGPVGYLGSRADDYRRLCAMPNVHALGARPLQQLPAYMQHMDVCMLCYRLDDYTKFIYPLKLHEYLASGRPIVGSPIPALDEFRDVISIASTPEEWSRAIQRALSDPDDDEARKRRQRIAAGYDWNMLVARIAANFIERLEREGRYRARAGEPATTVAGMRA